jgi:hypothetical protein
MIGMLYHDAPAELLKLEWLGESWIRPLYLDTRRPCAGNDTNEYFKRGKCRASLHL